MGTHKIAFAVRGSGHFPTDMLRYDSCYPTDGDAVDGISIGAGDYEDFVRPRVVKLNHIIGATKTEAKRLVEDEVYPTWGRWESFGWRIVECELFPDVTH